MTGFDHSLFSMAMITARFYLEKKLPLDSFCIQVANGHSLIFIGTRFSIG